MAPGVQEIKVPAELIMARAIEALGKALARTKPGVTLNSAGYVQDPSENCSTTSDCRILKPISARATPNRGSLPHTAEFSDKYKQICDERSCGSWFAEMSRLTGDPSSYVWLDAAQLIKHALGLARTFHGRRTILLYLFWEPTNASNFSVFDEHGREISDFAGRVLGGFPEFRAMSYRELWNDWESGQPSDWLRAHLERVRARYEIAI
jgi:hypothetical protein